MSWSAYESRESREIINGEEVGGRGFVLVQ